jgi:CheY-like chemotaxis protein
VEGRSEGLGRGSEFTIRLPALPKQASALVCMPAQEAASVDPAPCRILVVDDMPDTAANLAELLEMWGHQVRTAHDGSAALDMARAFQPNVILLDIGMPGMNGYETARHLRQDYAGRPLLLVAMTGYAQEGDWDGARAAGFDHHLIKPVDLATLRELLTNLNRD